MRRRGGGIAADIAVVDARVRRGRLRHRARSRAAVCGTTRSQSGWPMTFAV
jgi:uncharacterized protein (UPF0218 family)